MLVYAVVEAGDHPISRERIYRASRLLGVPTAALPALVCFARPWYFNGVRYLRLARFGRLDHASQVRVWRELADMFVRCAETPEPRGLRRKRNAGAQEDPQLAALAREWGRMTDPGRGPSVLDGLVSASDKLARTVASGATIAEAFSAAAGG